jgi:hypothetical protein
MRRNATHIIRELGQGALCPDWRRYVGPWNEGYGAYHEGLPAEFNPYSPRKQPDQHWAWSTGWHLAAATP